MPEVKAAELIDEVRDFHEKFEHKKIDPAIVLRFLTRRLNYVVGEVVRYNPDIVGVRRVIPAEDVEENGVTTPGWREAAFGAGNANPGRLEVPAFTTVIDSMRIVRDPDEDLMDEQKVYIVSFHTQYPEPFVKHVTFPAVALRDSHFEFTDKRKMGGLLHGWEDFGPLRYDYVPYFNPLTEPDAEIYIPYEIRSAVIVSTAMELAKRAELFNYAKMLEDQYNVEFGRVVEQTSDLASAKSGGSKYATQ